MGRKRKVPAGLSLKNWRDSFDESSQDENCSQLPILRPRTSRALLREDLSPVPSAAPSTPSSRNRSRTTSEESNYTVSGINDGKLPDLPSALDSNTSEIDDPDFHSEIGAVLAQGTSEIDDLRDIHSEIGGVFGQGAQSAEELHDPDLRDVHSEIGGVLAQGAQSEEELNDPDLRDIHSEIGGVFGQGAQSEEELIDPDLRDIHSEIGGVLAQGAQSEEELHDPDLRDIHSEIDDLDFRSEFGAQSADDDHDDPSDLDSWEGEEEDEEEEEEDGADNDYFRLLKAITEKWVLVELNHLVSKAASNAFWELSTSLIPALFETKRRLNVKRKTPQFVHLRRKLHKRILPTINHSTAFQAQGSTAIIDDVKDLERRNYEESHSKIYETASVEVRYLLTFITKHRLEVLLNVVLTVTVPT